MSATTAIHLGGVFCSAFVVFHLFFWRLFDWKRDLASLSFLNRQVMQVLNICLTAAFVVFAWISFVHAAELSATPLGRSLLLLLALFWYLRAGLQVVFFGLRKPLSIAFLVAFLVGGTLYAYPWLLTRLA